jgi:uncharacterized protein YqfA (UPF0365 family)
MRIRRIPLHRVVEPFIAIRQVDRKFDIRLLEVYCLVGGNTLQVARAYIRSRQENLPVEYMMLAAMDLAGRDPLAMVEGWVMRGVRTEDEIRASMEAAAEAGAQ